jgi:hypothetical protein
MVPSTALSKLSDYELHYIEKTLSEKLTQQHDLNKTWSAPSGTANKKTNMILTCMNAIRSQRDLNRKMSVKW